MSRKLEPIAERQLPSAVDAEKSVLGAVLLANDALLPARDYLVPEDFYVSQHIHIFGHMLEMADESLPIDLVTLTEHMARGGELEIGGGAPYLASLADGMPKVSNVEHYARIVKDKALLRGLIHMTHKIQLEAFESGNGAAAVLDAAHATLASLIVEQPTSGPERIKTIVRDNFAALERAFTEGRTVTGLSTGYTELDKLTSGLQPSELIVIAARPSVGKSALMLNIAENVTMRSDPQPTLLFSLEMSKTSLLTRLVSAHAQIDAHKWRTGHLSKDDWQRITASLGAISQAPLWIDDSGALTVGRVIARAQRIKKEHGLRLVIVDYLQLLSGSRRFSNRQEEVAEISRGLKAGAKELGMPLVALSQLKRTDRDDRLPQLSDLRESGAIEQDADVVMFIHRPKMMESEATPEEREQTDLVVAKQRNGPTDVLKFVFRSRITRFEECAPSMFGEYDQ